jgi:methylenetetrahydrofolate dehydrogenase (NADP+) / methenyltetrahydrofolate cyclohydrolase
MKLISGKKIAEKILSDLEKKIARQKIQPGLAVILVGKNPASEIYVKLKKKSARKIGMDFFLYRFGEKNTTREVIDKIIFLNQKKNIHGIIIQLPLPKKFAVQKIINSIDPKKDADGFHPKNLKMFLENEKKIQPVFSKAIMKFVEVIEKKKKIQRAIIFSKSKIFGEVMKKNLARKKIRAEYLIFDERKNSLETPAKKEEKLILKKLKNADLVVSAIGKKGLIKGKMLKNGAAVIDGGITKIGKKVWGDADLESMKNIAADVSPVPGGVGPVTVATLLENVADLFENQNKK